MLRKTILLLVACIFASSSQVVFARTSSVPVAHCQRPPLPQSAQALSKAAAKKLNIASKNYQRCVSKYHNARRAKVEQYSALAADHARAAGKLDDEFNGYVASLKKTVAAEWR